MFAVETIKPSGEEERKTSLNPKNYNYHGKSRVNFRAGKCLP
jgi:hypothetical protein